MPFHSSYCIENKMSQHCWPASQVLKKPQSKKQELGRGETARELPGPGPSTARLSHAMTSLLVQMTDMTHPSRATKTKSLLQDLPTSAWKCEGDVVRFSVNEWSRADGSCSDWGKVVQTLQVDACKWKNMKYIRNHEELGIMHHRIRNSFTALSC